MTKSDPEADFVEVVVEPKLLDLRHEFVDVRQISMLGEVTQREVVRELERAARDGGYHTGPIRVRWLLEVDAFGYRMPRSTLPLPDSVMPEDAERRREEAVEAFQRGVERAALASKPVVLLAPRGRVPQYQVTEGEPVVRVGWVEAAHRDRHAQVDSDCAFDDAEPLDEGCILRYWAYKEWFGCPDGFRFGPWAEDGPPPEAREG